MKQIPVLEVHNHQGSIRLLVKHKMTVYMLAITLLSFYFRVTFRQAAFLMIQLYIGRQNVQKLCVSFFHAQHLIFLLAVLSLESRFCLKWNVISETGFLPSEGCCFLGTSKTWLALNTYDMQILSFGPVLGNKNL